MLFVQLYLPLAGRRTRQVNQTQRGHSQLSGQGVGELPENHRDRMVNGYAFVVEPCRQFPYPRLFQVKWKESSAVEEGAKQVHFCGTETQGVQQRQPVMGTDVDSVGISHDVI